MRATSGFRAGTRQIGLPVKGSSMTFAPEYTRVSVPNSVRVGRNGTPMAPPNRRSVRLSLVHSVRVTCPFSIAILGAKPEIRASLTDDLMDQRIGAADEVGEIAADVVAIANEARHRLLLAHELIGEPSLLARPLCA